MESGNLSVQSGIDPYEIELIRKEAKAEMFRMQQLGGLISYAVCLDVPFEHILDVIKPIINDLQDMMREDSIYHEVYGKKYALAKDRLRF